MDPAVAGSPGSGPSLTFEDGLGERRYTIGPGNNPLELLRIRKTLSAVPSFEFGLRERAGRLAEFRNPWFGQVQAIELDRLRSDLVVVSDYVPGIRLARLLAAVEDQGLALDIDAARCLIRQLVSAVAAWQAAVPDVCHGAIGPERIVVTPEGRLVIVEYVLGSALEQLRFTRAQYWTELRVALPEAVGHRAFGGRVDVTQAGTVALALVLGRRLGGDEYPALLRDLVGSAACRLASGGLEPLPIAFREWLLRMLQLGPDRSFASARDAHQDMDAALGAENRDAESRALRAVLALKSARDTVDGFSSELDETPDVDLSPRIEAMKAFLARYPPRPVEEPSAPAVESRHPVPPSPSGEPISESPDAAAVDAAGPRFLSDLPDSDRMQLLLEFVRSRGFLVAAAILAGVLVLGGMVWLWSAATGRSGTLLIGTNPAGVSVVIDGVARGVTPLSLDLSPGNHTVDLIVGSERRRIPVTIAAGGQVSHFLELPRNTQELGELLVRTNVPGATVSIDGQVAGRSPVTVPALTPGPHTVVLQQGTASTTERVFIESGKTTSLVVSMPSAPEGNAAGWVSIAAPSDVQVFEDNRLIGSSSVERIMLPVGRHELEVVNEALNYRTVHPVQITSGEVSRIALRWPQGSLAINAIPWAEVWIKDQLIGETPIRNVSLPIGVHEVVFRHPQLGERRVSVTVPAGKPTSVGVDMGAK